MHKRNQYSRKVKFTEKNAKNKQLVPLTDPPAPPPIDKLIFSSAEEAMDEKFHTAESKRVSLASEDRTFSASTSDVVSRDSRKRCSLSLPKDQKPPKKAPSVPSQHVTGTIFTSLTSDRSERSSISTQASRRMSLPNEETVSVGFTESSDDLVDNLTNQKLNLQLKGITERIVDVLDEYDKHSQDNPAHRLFDTAGEKVVEMDDMSLKTNIMLLITDYKDSCTEREKILYSLSQWFSAEHMKNFMKVISDRSSSENLVDTYQNVYKSASQESRVTAEQIEDKETEVSSTIQQEDDEACSPASRSMSQLSVIQKRVSEKTGKSVHDIEAAWSSASSNMCELLQWAHSEGVADLVTVNNFLETLADHSQLFKSIREELQQQKQLGVMSDMTILRLSDQNAMLQKDIDKHEDQMVEARRTIRSLQKRNKDGPQTGIMWHKGTQTTMEVEEHSKEFLQMLLNNSDTKITDLHKKLSTVEKDNVHLKHSFENLQKEYENAADLFDKEITLYKEEVDRLMETIMHEEESTPDLPTQSAEDLLSVSKAPTHSTSTPAFPMPSRAGDLLSIAMPPKHAHSHSTPDLGTKGAGRDAESTHIPVVLEPASDLAHSLTPPREQKLLSRAAMPERTSGSGEERSDVFSFISSWSDNSGSLMPDVAGKDVSKHELKIRRKLQASLVDNAKTKFDLLEKERLLKIAELEIEELKRRLEELEDTEGGMLSPTYLSLSTEKKRWSHLKPSIGSIKKILQPGKKLTESNIEKLLASNNDRINVKLVKELVKQLNISKVNVHEPKARSKMLCDVQNVCNIVVQLQNKMTPIEGIAGEGKSVGTKDCIDEDISQTQNDIRIKLTGSSEINLPTRPRGTVSESKIEEGQCEGQKVASAGGRRVSIIQQVVDMTKSGSQEFESANSQFLLEVESELREVCNTLAALYNTDEDDAEQLLLSSTLAVPLYRAATVSHTKPARRRRSYSEGIPLTHMDPTTLKKDAKGRILKHEITEKRRKSMPEHVIYSTERVTSAEAKATNMRGLEPHRLDIHRPGAEQQHIPVRKTPQFKDPRKDLARLRQLLSSRRSGEPTSSALPAVYHLQEEREKLQEDEYSLLVDDVVLKGSRLVAELGDGYDRDQHRRRSLELYTSNMLQGKAGEGMTGVITGAGLSLNLYNREIHRKKSLEMYSRSSSYASSAGQDKDGSSSKPRYSGSQAGGYVAMLPASNIENTQFPLMLEKYMLPALLEPTEPEAKKKASQGKEKFRHTISVSGNYISPPPEALGFARRTGKFRTSAPACFDVRSSVTSTGWKDAAALFDPGSMRSSKSSSIAPPSRKPGYGSYSNITSPRPSSRTGPTISDSRPGSRSGPSIPDSRPGSRTGSNATVPQLRIVGVGEDGNELKF